MLFAMQTAAFHAQTTETPAPGFTLTISEGHRGPIVPYFQVLAVKLTNMSNEVMGRTGCDSFGGLYNFEVVYNGIPVKKTAAELEYRKQLEAGGCWGSMIGEHTQPGESRYDTLYYKTLKPGNYEITVTKETFPGEPEKTTTVRSNTLTFIVTEADTPGPIRDQDDRNQVPVWGASELASPIPGITFPGASVTFSWTPGIGVAQYSFQLGTTGAGSHNLYDSAATTATSGTVSGLPTNGEVVYARLNSLINGTWHALDYTYTEAQSAPSAVLRFPKPGSVLSGSRVTFSWDAAIGASGYALQLGTKGAGSNDFYMARLIPTTSVVVTGLTANGNTVLNARLY